MTTASSKTHSRRIKLIQPGLQLRMILAFGGIAALALLAEYLLLAARLSTLAAEMPEGGSYLSEMAPTLLRDVLMVAFGVLLPAIFGIGMLVTFRTAGPIYRFKEYLRAFARGEESGPCRIRKGDELQDLCDLINEALEAARKRSATREESAEALEV